MPRCIFRKPKRRLKLRQGLGVITVVLGAALWLELQSEVNPNKPQLRPRGCSVYFTILDQDRHRGTGGMTMQRWTSNSSSRLPQ